MKMSTIERLEDLAEDLRVLFKQTVQSLELHEVIEIASDRDWALERLGLLEIVPVDRYRSQITATEKGRACWVDYQQRHAPAPESAPQSMS